MFTITQQDTINFINREIKGMRENFSNIKKSISVCDPLFKKLLLHNIFTCKSLLAYIEICDYTELNQPDRVTYKHKLRDIHYRAVNMLTYSKRR